jgi:hypothetical protein
LSLGFVEAWHLRTRASEVLGPSASEVLGPSASEVLDANAGSLLDASGSEPLLERYGVDDVATVFRALVANRVVYVPGIAADDMAERLQRAWDFEPGYSKTAIVNAVTRAAHTAEWCSWTTTEELERAAGELLYARVWNVQRPADGDG